MMKKCVIVLTVFLNAILFSASAFAVAPQPSDHPEDRAALRAILEKGNEALSTHNFDAIAPSLHPSFTVITVDNKKFVGLDEFKKYYISLFEGPGAILTKVETKLEVDEASRFLDATTGVVYGTSNDTYHFKDGEVRTMKTRWSALTKKEKDGWKLVNLHFSTDLFDNPMLDALKAQTRKIAICSAVVGLFVGIMLMLVLRRKT